MAEAADQLLKALNSLDESPQFCVSGSVPPVLPGLDVAGVGPVGVPISPTSSLITTTITKASGINRTTTTVAHEMKALTTGRPVFSSR